MPPVDGERVRAVQAGRLVQGDRDRADELQEDVDRDRQQLYTGIRTAAFDEAARVLELAGAWQVTTDYSGEAGARATRSLLTAAPADRPTAIVYDNDIMAVAGLSVAAERGLSVPGDVSLLAWDDSQLCRLTHPTLSAMSHDVHGFGADAAHTLFGVITGEGPGSHPVPTPVLTPSGSTAPPKM